jgi:hypothetical protein
MNWWTRLRYGAACGAKPPWRLVDAGPCIIGSRTGNHEWHADGRGFIWNDSQWRWMGLTVNLSEVLRRHPNRGPQFEEH